MIAIDILKWPGMNQAFLTSFIASIVLTLAVIPYGKRRPVGKPTSWGEAMIGATYAFFVMFLAFGVVPDRWLIHASGDLKWTTDKVIFGPSLPFLHDILKPRSLGGWNPITLQYGAVADTVVVILHVIYFAMLIWIWIWWQKRGDAKPSTEVETSTFGRPLVRKA